jgi:hypothetical protein
MSTKPIISSNLTPIGPGMRRGLARLKFIIDPGEPAMRPASQPPRVELASGTLQSD